MYIKKALQRFNMMDCKPESLPSEQKLTFSEDAQAFDSQKYHKAIGSLIYAMTCTRPDLSWIVTKLAQYQHNPTVDHWTAVKHVFRYLKGIMNNKLCFQKCEDGLTLTGYSDAEWGRSGNRKSTSGYYFLLKQTWATVK